MRIERAGEHKAQNVSQIHSVSSHRMFSCTCYLHRWINGGQRESDNLWYKKIEQSGPGLLVCMEYRRVDVSRSENRYIH